MKNRPFIIQKENTNKLDDLSNNSYNTKNKIYLNDYDYNRDPDIISTKQIEFKNEIREIYNKQIKDHNNFECRRVNNFELSGNKKNNLIKPPIIIDENKKEKIINYGKNKNSNNNNIVNKRIRINKEKSNYTFNENRLIKSNNIKNSSNNILIKPINKYMFKKKYYCYHIKIYRIKQCYLRKDIITKNPINKRTYKISSNSEFMNKNELINNFGEINDNIFTEKIPVHFDSNININTINNNVDNLSLIENSFKFNKSIKNESATNFKINNESKPYYNNNKINNNNNNNNIIMNNVNVSFAKHKDNRDNANTGRQNKSNNNQKAIDNDELEMTFGIEDMHSKINTCNNQFDINSNINDFSTINNNTNHSIVINEYANNINNNYNEKNRIKNNMNIKIKDNENKINDFIEDEEEENQNENDDYQVLSEEDDVDDDEKEEEKIINNNNSITINKNNNNIVKRNEEKIIQTTQGKEIKNDMIPIPIPDKINKGLKLLEKIQIKRNSKKDYQFEINEKKTLSNSDNNNYIIDNFHRNNNNDNEILLNNSNRNNIFYEKEILEDDVYQKKNNTFNPKKAKIIFENMTKNKKCEIFNDILSEIFDKKEKEKKSKKRAEIRCKTPLFDRYSRYSDKENEDDEESECMHDDLYMMDDKKNTYNPKKIEKYEKIFYLNPIKNLEDILNKKKMNNNIIDYYNYNKNNNFNLDNAYDYDYMPYKQNVLTYNKKLSNKFKVEENESINDNNYLSNSNKIIDMYSYNKIIDYNYNLDNNKYILNDTPKFINKQKEMIKKLEKDIKNNNEKIYSYEEIMKINETNDLCTKDNLLSSNIINHCNSLLNYTDIDYIKSNITNTNNIKRNSIKEWSRKDMTKEIKEAEKYMKEMNKEMSKDNFKFQIIEILNTITVDNYEEILNRLSIFIYKVDNKGNNIYNKIIKPEILLENQFRFVEIIIDKAIKENGYVKLYAKLCSDLYLLLDKVINKYSDINIRKQIYNSENLKSLLIGECKQRFNDYQFDDIYENEKGEERDVEYDMIIIKKKFLGNINFIVELINVKLLSQKVGFDFLDILYRNYKEKEKNDKNKYLYLEGMVTLLNKFGKIVSERKNERHIQNLNNYMNDYIIPIINGKDEEDKNIPGYLKYKIINLIEKQKNNWEESLYEKSILAKGKEKNNNNNVEYNTCKDVNKDDNNTKINENNNDIISNQEDNEDLIINDSGIETENEHENEKNIYRESKSETLTIRIKKRNENKRNNSMEITMRYNDDFFLNNSMKTVEKEKENKVALKKGKK